MLPIKNYSVLRCWSGAILLLWAFIKKNKKKAIYEESVGSSEYTHTRTHVLVNLKTLLLHFGYTGNKSFQKVSRKSKRKDCSKTECWTWQPSVRSVMFVSFLNVKPAFLHAHTDRQGSTVYHKAARHQMKMPAVVQTVGSAMLELWRSCDIWSYVGVYKKAPSPPPILTATWKQYVQVHPLWRVDSNFSAWECLKSRMDHFRCVCLTVGWSREPTEFSATAIQM